MSFLRLTQLLQASRITTSHPYNMSTGLNSDHDTTLFDGLLHALLQSLHQRSGWSHAGLARRILSIYQEASPLDRIGQVLGEEGSLIVGLIRRMTERGGINESAIANNLAQGFDQVTYFVFPPERHDLVLIALQLAGEFLYQPNIRYPPTVKGNNIHVRLQDQSSDAVHISHFPSSEGNGLTGAAPPKHPSNRGPFTSTQDDDIDRDGTSNYSTTKATTHELEKSLGKFSTFLKLSKNIFPVYKHKPLSDSYPTVRMAKKPTQKIQQSFITKSLPSFKTSEDQPFDRGRDRKDPRSCTGLASDSQF